MTVIYRILRIVETIRYILIVIGIQIPMYVVLIWLCLQVYDVIIGKNWVYMTYEIFFYIRTIPILGYVWFIIFLIALLKSKNIFSFKETYAAHVKRQLWLEYLMTKRLSIFNPEDKQ